MSAGRTDAKRISDFGFVIPDWQIRDPNTPRVLAAIQAAHIHPSTAGGGLIKLSEQAADAVGESANGVRKFQHHVVSAVAGAGPPPRTDIHY